MSKHRYYFLRRSKVNPFNNIWRLLWYINTKFFHWWLRLGHVLSQRASVLPFCPPLSRCAAGEEPQLGSPDSSLRPSLRRPGGWRANTPPSSSKSHSLVCTLSDGRRPGGRHHHSPRAALPALVRSRCWTVELSRSLLNPSVPRPGPRLGPAHFVPGMGSGGYLAGPHWRVWKSRRFWPWLRCASGRPRHHLPRRICLGTRRTPQRRVHPFHRPGVNPAASLSLTPAVCVAGAKSQRHALARHCRTPPVISGSGRQSPGLCPPDYKGRTGPVGARTRVRSRRRGLARWMPSRCRSGGVRLPWWRLDDGSYQPPADPHVCRLGHVRCHRPAGRLQPPGSVTPV